MSEYSSIQRSVIALYKSGAKRIVLSELQARPVITQKRGESLFSSFAAESGSSVDRAEIINVWSNLIITEDGAFEMPAGWPGNGDYPSGTPVPSPRPPSLINSGGTLSLDVNVQYYQQKRSHLAIFQVGDQLQEDWLLVPMAAPFSGYYQGLTSATTFAPGLYLNAKPGLTGAALTRLNQLTAAGITSV